MLSQRNSGGSRLFPQIKSVPQFIFEVQVFHFHPKPPKSTASLHLFHRNRFDLKRGTFHHFPVVSHFHPVPVLKGLFFIHRQINSDFRSRAENRLAFVYQNECRVTTAVLNHSREGECLFLSIACCQQSDQHEANHHLSYTQTIPPSPIGRPFRLLVTISVSRFAPFPSRQY